MAPMFFWKSLEPRIKKFVVLALLVPLFFSKVSALDVEIGKFQQLLEPITSSILFVFNWMQTNFNLSLNQTLLAFGVICLLAFYALLKILKTVVKWSIVALVGWLLLQLVL